MIVDSANLHTGPAPSVGRIVHYRLPLGVKNEGEARPAIVIRVWSETCVQLAVIPDGSNDGIELQNGNGMLSGLRLLWATSVVQGDQPGQWGWPPRVPA